MNRLLNPIDDWFNPSDLSQFDRNIYIYRPEYRIGRKLHYLLMQNFFSAFLVDLDDDLYNILANKLYESIINY